MGVDIGKVLPKTVMILRNEVGNAKNEETDNSYDLSYHMNGSPIVISGKTGQYYTLSWDDIIELAIKKGIDEELEEGEKE